MTLASALLALTVPVLAQEAKMVRIDWTADYPAALKRAGAEKKLVVVHFWSHA